MIFLQSQFLGICVYACVCVCIRVYMCVCVCIRVYACNCKSFLIIPSVINYPSHSSVAQDRALIRISDQ